ncbi:MAG: hypothetical protein JWQ35_1197 [Bacteriovoracaceae bacterium]|nr:hypothetical protein [Bacteriovoracaceae bacterium]
MKKMKSIKNLLALIALVILSTTPMMAAEQLKGAELLMKRSVAEKTKDESVSIYQSRKFAKEAAKLIQCASEQDRDQILTLAVPDQFTVRKIADLFGMEVDLFNIQKVSTEDGEKFLMDIPAALLVDQ